MEVEGKSGRRRICGCVRIPDIVVRAVVLIQSILVLKSGTELIRLTAVPDAF